MVICNEPETLAPAKGFFYPNSALQAINPGISTSARSISFLPSSHKLMSLILDSFK